MSPAQVCIDALDQGFTQGFTARPKSTYEKLGGFMIIFFPFYNFGVFLTILSISGFNLPGDTGSQGAAAFRLLFRAKLLVLSTEHRQLSMMAPQIRCRQIN